ncbi:hypothetical protein GUITHDRAFT_141116 [Guillardia theta CCMP2712]|uniref:Uncharacterized protein n=1 Tax=Guillardia theta (strain CCMP2712) TaxID=905079 RepID=L1J3L9_GUITC|nr:hypothetical protein GUITHDRAFT_141116 [Guillardia theta CCMP2712]EKX42724.1 hypothetical protein GUITHDRAFT_141116 [Guillardia theta CCMP2712]|eukprot:XP_005829704.1 hypothetical protein GUITHDRAFT_141116 [Guillardia theta CCMP2712]
MQRESLSRLDIRESVNTQQSLRECLENLKIDNVSELSKFRQEEIRELDLPSEAKQSLLSLHAHCMDENTTLKDLLESLEQEDSQDAKFRILRSRELRNVQQSHTIRRLSDLSLSSKEHALLSDRGHLGLSAQREDLGKEKSIPRRPPRLVPPTSSSALAP